MQIIINITLPENEPRPIVTFWEVFFACSTIITSAGWAMSK